MPLIHDFFLHRQSRKIVSCVPTYLGNYILIHLLFSEQNNRTDPFLKQIEKFPEPFRWSMSRMVLCAASPFTDKYCTGSANASISSLPLWATVSLPRQAAHGIYKTFGLSVTYAFWLWRDGPGRSVLPQ